MINVRAEVVIHPRRRYMTGPIRNPAALAALLNQGFAYKGQRLAIQIHDDEAHAAIADASIEHARRHGRLQRITWGDGRYTVEFARIPRAAGQLPVVGGFPLLDVQPPAAAPPLSPWPQSHVLAKSPGITEYDVHGNPAKRYPDARAPRRADSGGKDGQEAPADVPASAPPRRAARVTVWFDRLVAWFFGDVPQGKVLDA